MDEVEGREVANIESWDLVYTGDALSYDVTSGLTATKAYRFRVKSKSEYLIESPFSSVSIFYAAALPSQIVFDTTNGEHLEQTRVSIWLSWQRPTLTADELPIDAYIVYWDEGFRSSGNFTQLARIDTYDQSFFNVTGGILTTGHHYSFQVSAVNKVGEGPMSDEIAAIAASLPGKPTIPERTASSKTDASTASVTIRWYE